jgi:hypothetical protein
MKILNFRVKNHKSVRDEAALELLDPSINRLTPAEGKTWNKYVHNVASIFGANASGKSNFLDALLYFITAIRVSSTVWQSYSEFPHAPFKLNKHDKNSESAYELDFLLNNKRYRYGFGVSPQGITFESLEYIPTKRWKRIFSRERLADGKYNTIFSKGIQKLEVNDRELALSRALVLKRKDVLQEISESIINGIDFILLNRDQKSRIDSIAEDLAENAMSFEELELLLQIADIGIQKVGLWQQENEFDGQNFPPDIPILVQAKIMELLSKIDSTDDDNSSESLKPKIARIIQRRLEFYHYSYDENTPPLYIDEESDGTLAWLAVSFAALKAIRKGGVVCGDELDSSLHPYLVHLLVRLFTDTSINIHGAQIIFTTHDATLLATQEDLGLSSKNIWFTEKTRQGVTELFSLDDFQTDLNSDTEKLYLMGTYGAVPFIAGSIFKALVNYPSSKLSSQKEKNEE